MIFFVCDCGFALRTVGDPVEVDYLVGTKCEWYPDTYKCPLDGCGGRMQFADVVESESLAKLRVADVTPQEAFIAFQGLGLPAERDCGMTAVRELLIGQRIVAADLQQVRGANRTIVHSLKLEDGRRLFLASGTEGSTAYRISDMSRYAKEELDG